MLFYFAQMPCINFHTWDPPYPCLPKHGGYVNSSLEYPVYNVGLPASYCKLFNAIWQQKFSMTV